MRRLVLLLLRGTGDTDVSDVTATLPDGVTATPLALEAQDEVIEGGDASRAPIYPISLHVSGENGVAPRVWVVQQRAVRASEWNFDPNPDTASFLNGMAVRPVIGIPWSEDNAGWFERLGVGAAFRVQMNTGVVLTFTFEDKRGVRRSDTDIFRQVTPGLVVLLLGETDADGLPTAERTLITANYPIDQELGRGGELLSVLALPPVELTPTPILTVTPIPFSGPDVQIIRVTTSEGQITTRLRLFNGGNAPLTITPEDIWLALGYAENPQGPRIPAEELTPFDLLPGQAADITLVWRSNSEPYGSLEVGAYRYAFQFDNP